MGPVAGQHVEFLEAARVEQVLDALAGEQLALGVLTFDRPGGTRVECLLAALPQVLQLFGHRVRRHGRRN